jgi:hypothetical protein
MSSLNIYRCYVGSLVELRLSGFSKYSSILNLIKVNTLRIQQYTYMRYIFLNVAEQWLFLFR